VEGKRGGWKTTPGARWRSLHAADGTKLGVVPNPRRARGGGGVSLPGHSALYVPFVSHCLSFTYLKRAEMKDTGNHAGFPKRDNGGNYRKDQRTPRIPGLGPKSNRSEVHQNSKPGKIGL